MDVADPNRPASTIACSQPIEYTEDHEKNIERLLSLAEKQYEIRLQATDSLDNKLGFVLAALACLLVATSSLKWSSRWYNMAMGAGCIAAIGGACGCVLSGLWARGYAAIDLQKFRGKYLGKSSRAFADHVLTDYVAHIEVNTRLNARKAGCFKWAVTLAGLVLLLYALEIAIEKMSEINSSSQSNTQSTNSSPEPTSQGATQSTSQQQSNSVTPPPPLHDPDDTIYFQKSDKGGKQRGTR